MPYVEAMILGCDLIPVRPYYRASLTVMSPYIHPASHIIFLHGLQVIPTHVYYCTVRHTMVTVKISNSTSTIYMYCTCVYKH